jgi:hypothetical protein
MLHVSAYSNDDFGMFLESLLALNAMDSCCTSVKQIGLEGAQHSGASIIGPLAWPLGIIWRESG